MNDKDNQRLLNDMCKELRARHKAISRTSDNLTMLDPIGMYNRVILIEKTGKDKIRLNDNGETLALAEITYEFHIEHTTVAKEFWSILKLYKVKFDKKLRILYIDTNFKNSLLAVSRLRQVITQVYDLVYFKLVPDIEAKEK